MASSGSGTAAITPVKAGYWYCHSESPIPVASIPSLLFTHLFAAYADVKRIGSNYEVAFPDAYGVHFSTFTQTVQKRNTNVRTLLSIGGDSVSSSSTFASMARQPTARQSFIKSSIKLARSNNFHGLSLHWLYPSTEEDMNNFGSLLNEWRAAVDLESNLTGNDPLLLVAAVNYTTSTSMPTPMPMPTSTPTTSMPMPLTPPTSTPMPTTTPLPMLTLPTPTPTLTPTPTPMLPTLTPTQNVVYPFFAISQKLDWINVVAYDFYNPALSHSQTGPFAALHIGHIQEEDPRCADPGVKAWIHHGVPANKIVFGLPFYGAAWRLTDDTQRGIFAPADGPADGAAAGVYINPSDGTILYNQIKYFIETHPGSQPEHHDDYVVDIFSAENTCIAYNDTHSITAKVKYAKENALLGYYAWHVGGDRQGTLSQAAFEAWDQFAPATGNNVTCGASTGGVGTGGYGTGGALTFGNVTATGSNGGNVTVTVTVSNVEVGSVTSGTGTGGTGTGGTGTGTGGTGTGGTGDTGTGGTNDIGTDASA